MKRIICILLSLIMALTVIPIAAFAEETSEPAIAAANAEQSIPDAFDAPASNNGNGFFNWLTTIFNDWLTFAGLGTIGFATPLTWMLAVPSLFIAIFYPIFLLFNPYGLLT